MIGDRLKEIRNASNKTQNDISTYLNIEQSAYSKYENNIRNVNIETLVKIADYYKITLDNLVGRKTETEDKITKIIKSLNEDEKNTIIEIIKLIYPKTKKE